MSTYYDIHTEILTYPERGNDRTDKQWICIDPLIRYIPYASDPPFLLNAGERDNYRLASTYWSGSRSYFQEAYWKLEELGRIIEYDELSEELKKRYLYLKKDPESKDPFIAMPLLAVDFRVLEDLLKNTPEHDQCGFVKKRDILQFENGNLEDISDWLEPEDFEKKSEKVREAYRFYEWNDPMGWNGNLREVLKRVYSRLCDFEQLTYLSSYDTRLIVHMS